MTLNYEIQKDYNTVKATDENGKELFIPMDLGNTDYQNYLATLDDSNKL